MYNKHMKRVVLAIVLAGYAVFTWWFVTSLQTVAAQNTAALEQLSKPPSTPVKIFRLDGVTQGLAIPAWQWFNTGRIWAYVSAKQPIDHDFVPQLTEITTAHGDWLAGPRIQPEANQALTQLAAAATEAEQPFIVTSAYRSATEQQQLYDETTASSGAAYAAAYIAHPGNSEHQLGLAVDVASYSSSCQQAFSNCVLSAPTAAWLADNAPDYGFILRYPADKEDVTGVSHETWHFRYLGTAMAKFVRDSGLTYDELIEKIQEQRG